MLYDLGNDIFAVDSMYVRPAFAAVYVVRGRGGSAVVETSWSGSAPILMESLGELGIAPEEIDCVFITHVHLDHAGGAGAYADLLPNARFVVHPRGERHLIDPSRLVAAAKAVYGPERFTEMHGEVISTPKERVISPTDAQAIAFGGRTMICLDTPGHCRHHFSYLLKDDSSIFTGDVFGMMTTGMRSPSHDGVIVSTSPTQFDPDAMLASISRIVSLAPRRALLTHFGAIDRVSEAAEDMRRELRHHIAIAEDARGDLETILRELTADYADEAVVQGWRTPLCDDAQLWLSNLTLMNAQGMADWYARTHKDA